ncbi:MAG: response regulator [Lachnospiraceae bacterium]|nr:response regulator [Lachnospiraceae bacterium]MDE7201103.1 response regulator [Lachnospiraceae bacterium]
MNLLIVDDEHHIVNYMAAFAEEHCGNVLEVYKAYSGMEALKILADIKIDIILLDIQMPGLTGLELADKISKTWSNCRIIFLTAYDNFDYIYKATDLPHISYLLKTEPESVILDTLSQAVGDIIEEQKQQTILDDTLKRNKYLSHLLIQNTLRILQSGMPMETLHSENTFLESDNPLDLNAPVYLIYMNIRHRSFKDCRTWDYNQCLQYLHLAEFYASNRFSCFLLQLDNGDGLWFFQCRENADFGVSNPISFLKT